MNPARLRLNIVMDSLGKRILSYGEPKDWFLKLPEDIRNEFVRCLSEVSRLAVALEKGEWDIGPVLEGNVLPVAPVCYPIDVDALADKLFIRYLMIANNLRNIEYEMAVQGMVGVVTCRRTNSG
jgi:hypothetical protein